MNVSIARLYRKLYIYQTREIDLNAQFINPNMVYEIQIGKGEKGREFYAEGVHSFARSLEDCSSAGYKPLFMPELAIAKAGPYCDARLWRAEFTTMSAKITGRSRRGNAVVVYAHVPTSLCDPTNVRRLIDGNAVINGALPIPEEEFLALLDQDGNGRVFVVDHSRLHIGTRWGRYIESFGIFGGGDALDNPQTIPFLGGRKIAADYVAAHKRNCNRGSIDFGHSGDLADRPIGRILYFGSNNSLCDYHHIDRDATCFVGKKAGIQVSLESKACAFSMG